MEQNNHSLLLELEVFLAKAMCSTYSVDGPRSIPKRLQFTEYAYEEGDWSYQDSYAGYFQSWGQEVVWYKNIPFWTQIYGGGVNEPAQVTKEFAAEIFNFLKRALSSKKNSFQPRGPDELKNNNWLYQSEWHGDIVKFCGQEKIFCHSNLVFTHDFRGGLFIE